MKNTIGTSVITTLFGESHGPAVGAVIDGLAPGIRIDEDFIRSQLELRKPYGRISTARREDDSFEILSGVFEGRTTGTPLCIMIRNKAQNSRDYSSSYGKARPGHADYTAYVKYNGFEDYRGGGHFSGRITAALVAAGAIALTALREKDILIGTHIARLGGISDRHMSGTEYSAADIAGCSAGETIDRRTGMAVGCSAGEIIDRRTELGTGCSAGETIDRRTELGTGCSADQSTDRMSGRASDLMAERPAERITSRRPEPDEENLRADIERLNQMRFAVLDDRAAEAMQAAITEAAEAGDSLGGILETAICGLPAGIGEPWFDTLEGVLAHGIFSIPGIKGVQFGGGFDLADARGSYYNDPLYMKDGRVKTRTNNNGGINGGISNGMPVIFRSAVKPTPSIYKDQETVDFRRKEDAALKISGRHDPAIIHRARVVIDSVTALLLCDMLAQRCGTDWTERNLKID